MPRRARVYLPGIPLHITQRGHYRRACFLCDGDFLHFMSLLRKYSELMNVSLHAYVLMSNHFHLLASFPSPPGDFMKAILQLYTQYFNRRHGVCGTLWQGRFHSCPVPAERYLMTCHHYIELNPVRARMVTQASDYLWSSHRGNAGLAEDSLLRPHFLYQTLGATRAIRGAAYQKLFTPPSHADICELRRATTANVLPGSRVARCGRPPAK